jgi:hypothetical protein
VPALVPSLRHANPQIRFIATDVLRTVVCGEAARAPGRSFAAEMISSQIMELLLTELCLDPSAEVRGRAGETVVYLTDPRTLGVLRKLLLDHEWFVRLRTVRALANLRQAIPPLHSDIRDRLCDSHWRVREAAAQTLLSTGQEGKNHLYEHFLNCPDPDVRKQIVEVIERSGLMPALLGEYGDGQQGMGARLVEQLASEAAPLGVAGVLRTLNPELRQKFLDRFSAYAQSRAQLAEETQPEVVCATNLRQMLAFSTGLAA